MGQIDENVYLATLENLRDSELYTDEMEEQVQKYVEHVIESILIFSSHIAMSSIIKLEFSA